VTFTPACRWPGSVTPIVTCLQLGFAFAQRYGIAQKKRPVNVGRPARADRSMGRLRFTEFSGPLSALGELLYYIDLPKACVLIRPVEARDIAAWSAMRGRLWPDADPLELADEARAFVDGSTQPLLEAVFIADGEQARPVGFLELSVRPFADGCDSRPVPHVEGWYVEVPARRCGIGRALVRAAEEWAQARGFRELASDTEVQNAASQRAHENCGFQEVERLIKFRKMLGAS
jgi:aminoglycoside 6'-N-acetyltransferase I